MATMQLLSRETIKPSSPTPSHLRSYSLSLLDHHVFHMYMPVLCFYPAEGTDDHNSSLHAEKSSLLKSSLSKTLSLYYPFAGRFPNDRPLFVDCNDEGVDFWEARIINCEMSEIMNQVSESDTTLTDLLFPDGIAWSESYKHGSLVVIQLSLFECGGMALSVCITHKVADGCTINSFMTDWAATATWLASGSGTPPPPPPEFIGNSITSASEVLDIIPETKVKRSNCVTKRFVFEASKIVKLRAMATADSSGVLKKPSRVETVTALLYKCAMAAAKEKSGFFKPARLLQVVDMRQRVDPPFPLNSVGNFCWAVIISIESEEQTKLPSLVGELRNGLMTLSDKSKNNMGVKEWLSAIQNTMKEVKSLLDHDIDVYRCSSVCGYPLYEVNYGWGKPVVVPMPSNVVKNTFTLMDTMRGDGIEAWVTLEMEDMAIFETLLQYWTKMSPAISDRSRL